MVKKIALALAVGLGLLGVTGARASAQEVVVRVPSPFVVVPPAYVELGPPPGPGYVWVPQYHRWVFQHYYVHDRDFYRGYAHRDFDRGRHWR
jgi:hypothetical protein